MPALSWVALDQDMLDRIVSASMANQSFDTAALLKVMQEASIPLMNKLERIEEKIAAHATKSDLTQLRTEVFDRIDRIEEHMQNGYVPKDVYETRHLQLVERDGRIEQSMREVDTRYLQWQTVQEGRLQSAKREIDDRFAALDKKIDEKTEAAEDRQLSSKDRTWLRGAQIAGWLGVAAAILDFIFQHANFH